MSEISSIPCAEVCKNLREVYPGPFSEEIREHLVKCSECFEYFQSLSSLSCEEARQKVEEAYPSPPPEEIKEHLVKCSECFEYLQSLQSLPKVSLLKMSFILYGLMIFFGLVWIYFQEKGLPRIYEPLLRGDSLLRNLLLGSGLALGVILFSRFSVRVFDWAQEMERTFKKILGNLKGYEIFFMALLSGFGEEIFFRGAMQHSWGIVLTSLIFGFLHMMPSSSPPEEKGINLRGFSWTIFAILMGFALGYSFEYTGSLVAPITTHFLINLVNLYFIAHSDD